ncbi:MAG TPA: metal ABC transporter permease, partial [Pseudolabrys sp.]|nr:metal ABC transporter permease [Pseudolabrys sp.]
MTANRHPAPAKTPQVTADRGALLRTVINLWPYIWPADRADLKLRVLGALVLLLAAKLATIAVPFTFKWATDALVGQG